MPKRSAGILLYRKRGGDLEVLLVHPGGPFWRNKDVGAWQIPKGLIAENESAADAACRETEEELGISLSGDLVPLVTIRQAGGKVVDAFALLQEVEVEAIRSNLFVIEWPPRSGRQASFPEIDSARWLSLAEAERLMLASQLTLLAALRALAEEEGRTDGNRSQS